MKNLNLSTLLNYKPELMILTVGIVLAGLIAINFLLLFFSVNKIEKRSMKTTQKVIFKPKIKLTTTELPLPSLAPTGS